MRKFRLLDIHHAAMILLSLTLGSMPGAETPALQAPLPAAQAPPPFRTLGSFTHLHIVQTPGPEGKLQRQFVKQLRPLPFGWVESALVPADAGPDFLIAIVRRHPSVRAGVLVEFQDIQGRPIASVEGSPAGLRRTTTGAIIEVVITLNNLAFSTTGADRTVASFSKLHIRSLSDDTDALRDRVVAQLGERRFWDIVDSKRDTNAEDILDCSIVVERGIPPIVRFKCADANSRPVLSIMGANCRSCYGPLQFSAKGDTGRAADDLVKELLAHRALVTRVYAPQLTRD